MKRKFILNAAGAIWVTLVLIAPILRAQNTQPLPPGPQAATTGGGQLQQVVVTGYIVPRVGDGPQPVVTLGQKYFQDQNSQTVTDVINRLAANSLGSFTPAANSGNSFSPGAAAVSLRGLGVQNTLVLVDGFRFPTFPFPQNFNISFVDLNSIPLAAVDRIEILKDGGSATYGSDAIAGVINLITKDEYDGADLLFHYGISQRGDDEVYRASATAGFTVKPTDTSKFNVVAAFDYYESSPILATDRGFSNVLDHAKFSSGYNNQLSDFNPTAGSYLGLSSGTTYFVPPGAATTSISTSPHPNPDHSADLVYDTDVLAREQRFGAFVKMNYEVTPWLKLHEEFINQNNEEISITPNQGFGFTDQLVIPANNPFNTTGEALQPLGQDTREFGPWRTTTKVNTFRNLAGITLQNLPKSWFADFSIAYGESDGTSHIQNSIDRIKMQEALEGQLPGFVGIFYNPFVDQSANRDPNPKALVDAIRTFQEQSSRTSVLQYALKGGGELFDLPAGPVTLGLGAEYRSEELIIGNDANSHNVQTINGIVVSNITSASFPGQLTRGRRYLWTGYGEVSIPILGGKWSWPGARLLELLIDERYDHYSDFGGASKPKFSIRYKPFDDLTLRATYAEGFRAPSLAELFTVQIAELPFSPLSDPVTGQTGLLPTVFVRGNPALKPVQSYSYYLDAVWTPGASDPEHSWWGWANGFTAYVDWYEVNRHNTIGPIPDQVVLSGNNPAMVIRNPVTQSVEFLNDPFTNLGGTLTEGWDFGCSYVTKEFWWGKLEADLDANYIQNYSVKTILPTGKFSIWDETDSFNLPDFKLIGSLFYSKKVFGIDTFRTGFVFNYVDSEHDALDDFKGTNPAGGTQPNGAVHRIGSWTTVDWQISYEFGPPAEVTAETPAPGYAKDGRKLMGEKAISPQPEGRSSGCRKWLANTTLRFGITNIGDVKPPFADIAIGYDSSAISPVGRALYFELEKKF